MAKLISDRTKIDKMRFQRQAAEQKLAKRLYEAFAAPAAMGKLRTVGTRVVSEMIEFEDVSLEKVLDECQVLDIFKSKRFASLDDLLKGADTLTPSDIADIIYICGEWVLAGGGTRSGEWPANEIQGAYKVGITPDEPVGGSDGWAYQHATDAQKAVWKQEPGGRYRGAWSQPMEPHIAESLGPGSTPGINVKRSLEGSTVLTVDRLFGLLRGADISGSATEGASILERWGSDLLHSAYYLLPLATLVYNAHHTVLEVALTLSLNGINDYHVGFYTTLLPNGAPAELGDVVPALREAEERVEHFVIFYENMQPAGCLLFDQAWETNLLKGSDFSNAVKMLAQAQRLQGFPSRDDVLGLLRAMAPALAADLPDGMNDSSARPSQ
ncbi:hypothetical protein WKW80_33150 [Variovorax humicola]|uniref:Uncharacterized protein n=1 Tax=Variovorax humicola TaxID=1769758 RepID=A0ABU8WA39_9BURK